MLAASAAALVFASPASAFGPLSSFGSFGSNAGQFRAAGDLDIAPDGSLYVPDFFNNRVDVFSSTGEFRFAFGKGVSPGGTLDVCTSETGCAEGVQTAAAGGLEHPEHVAIGPQGEVYVSGALAHRVDVFSPQGEFRFAFGKGVNQLGGNVCTALTGCKAGISDATAGSVTAAGLAVDPGGTVYVAGTNARIDVFSRLGDFQFAFGTGVNLGAGNPNICTATTGCRRGLFSELAGAVAGPDVDVTPTGDVAVLNFLFGRVDFFSPQGDFRFAFGKAINPGGGDTCTLASGCLAGRRGTGAGEIAAPSKTITVAPNGHLFISNSEPNERIDEYTLDGQFVRGFGAGVIDGQAIFQICTAGTGCRAGLRDSGVAGAAGNPKGVAVDPSGAVYVTEIEPTRIAIFGDPPIPPTEPPGPVPPGQLPPTQPPSNGPPPTSARNLRFLELKRNRRKGTATLAVEVSGAGRVLVKGTEIPKAIRTASSAGIVKLPVVPVRKAKRQLSATGKARLRVVVTFTPAGDAPLSKAKTLVLKKAPR